MTFLLWWYPADGRWKFHPFLQQSITSNLHAIQQNYTELQPRQGNYHSLFSACCCALDTVWIVSRIKECRSAIISLPPIVVSKYDEQAHLTKQHQHRKLRNAMQHVFYLARALCIAVLYKIPANSINKSYTHSAWSAFTARNANLSEL